MILELARFNSEARDPVAEDPGGELGGPTCTETRVSDTRIWGARDSLFD
jgi:hypothetical protein